jgi:drug/metabolite transporter (DMT)-like permease
MPRLVTASVVLFILGVLAMLAGVVFVFLGRFGDPPEKDDESLTMADLFARVNAVAEKLEKRYRWGIVMLGVGLALIGAGAWVAAMTAAETASAPPPPPPPG